MVRKDSFMKDPEYVTLPQERLEQLEKLLGRHGFDWRLVNVSSLATPAGDPAWQDRWYKTLLWHRHFLQAMRAWASIPELGTRTATSRTEPPKPLSMSTPYISKEAGDTLLRK